MLRLLHLTLILLPHLKTRTLQASVAPHIIRMAEDQKMVLRTGTMSSTFSDSAVPESDPGTVSSTLSQYALLYSLEKGN